MSKKLFEVGLKVQELEARQEMSVVVPGDLAAEAAKKDGEGRCSDNEGTLEVPVEVLNP